MRDNTALLSLAHCIWISKSDPRACFDLLHILVEAKISLYLCTQSSLKRDFTRLMWPDRWILGKESDKQITGELRVKPFRTSAVWSHTHFSNLWICSSLYANSEVKIRKVFFFPRRETATITHYIPTNKYTYCQ